MRRSDGGGRRVAVGHKLRHANAEAEVEVKDTVVIVTGAASGIGKACAARFAADGAALVLADRDDVGEAAAAIEAGGGQALAVNVGVSDEDSVANLFAVTADRFGRHLRRTQLSTIASTRVHDVARGDVRLLIQ